MNDFVGERLDQLLDHGLGRKWAGPDEQAVRLVGGTLAPAGAAPGAGAVTDRRQIRDGGGGGPSGAAATAL